MLLSQVLLQIFGFGVALICLVILYAIAYAAIEANMKVAGWCLVGLLTFLLTIMILAVTGN